jgi:type I restriction enzyme S subunit
LLPLENEQIKIAEFLTSIDEKVEAEERKLDQAKKFKKALLQQMFV